MPLKSGPGQKTHSYNVNELMGVFKEKGKIGTSRPRSKKKALAQANAIAFSKAREGKRGK